ncbi:MAG TPA: sigma-70 family RNA polymerase sigma factor [Phenylobacterium sp.]|nr:sigma-70 family RNA polymerase sigma factor [Phenylobacterium sp.]
MDQAQPFASESLPSVPLFPSAVRDDGFQREEFSRELIALTPSLRGVAFGLMKSAAEADDLVQETLLKAWQARTRFQPGTNFKAWVFTILRNSAKSRFYVARRFVGDPDGHHTAGLSSEPEQEWRLRYQDMLAALDRLKPHAREALLLIVAAGLSYEQAAQVLDCPVNTVKSRVKRARDELATALDPTAAGQRFDCVSAA